MREEGTPFGSYLLLKRLARGGMAEVFLARQRGPEGFDRQVAVKRILPHLADSDDFVRQFQDEARLAARLSHPNVVHIYEFGKVGEHYFIAMEYVDGVHAGALIQHGATELMPPAMVARIGADACAGLSYAHMLEDSEGRPLHLVHRDISPPNLMVSFGGVVKLVDFGIAKAVNSVDKTKPGIVKGKFAYMSPEQTMGKKLDGRSDVFSLGLVCWELLAGRVALERADPVEAMKAIRDGKLPSIRVMRPDVPPGLALVIEQALKVRPQERPSAADLGNAFEGYIKSSPELATAMQLSEWIKSRFRRPGQEPVESMEPPMARMQPQLSSLPAPLPGRSPTQSPGRSPTQSPGRSPTQLPGRSPTQSPLPPPGQFMDGSPRAVPSLAPPGLDPKVSFLQEGVDDDAPTQIASKPAAPQGNLPSLPRALASDPGMMLPAQPMGAPAPNTLPPLTLPPGDLMASPMPDPGTMLPDELSSPSGAPLHMQGPHLMSPGQPQQQLGAYWARFTGTLIVQARRRRILFSIIGILVLALIIVLALSSEDPPAQSMAGMGRDGGMAQDAAPSVDAGSMAAPVPQDAAPSPEDGGTAAMDAPRAERATLEIVTEPQGALVTVDDLEPRESPVRLEDLAVGKHAVTIELEGYHDIVRTIDLDAGLETFTFSLQRVATKRKAAKKGKLSVTTQPSSQVYLGQQKLGATPFANKPLAPGSYTLTFKQNGYLLETRRVTIQAGKVTKLNIKLRKR